MTKKEYLTMLNNYKIEMLNKNINKKTNKTNPDSSVHSKNSQVINQKKN
jgi:hypothetical protein